MASMATAAITSFPKAAIISFSKSSKKSASGLYSAEQLELTVENVDKVLENVRSYLIADGGNVDVVSVENGIVSLELQGQGLLLWWCAGGMKKAITAAEHIKQTTSFSNTSSTDQYSQLLNYYSKTCLKNFMEFTSLLNTSLDLNTKPLIFLDEAPPLKQQVLESSFIGLGRHVVNVKEEKGALIEELNRTLSCKYRPHGVYKDARSIIVIHNLAHQILFANKPDLGENGSLYNNKACM